MKHIFLWAECGLFAYTNSYYFLLFVCYYKDRGLIAFELWENKALCSTHWRDYSPEEPAACEGWRQPNYQTSTQSYLLNYKEVYVSFSHLENNWLEMDAFRCLTDSLYVPFPSILAPSTTLLPIPSLLSPHSQSWFTLRTHLVLFQPPAFTQSTHHCCQILCSATHVSSFDLEYIFFWTQPVLLGNGSIQTMKPIWLTFAWDCKGPSRVEEFEGVEGSGLTALFWHHTWHLTRQCKKQEHTGR